MWYLLFFFVIMCSNFQHKQCYSVGMKLPFCYQLDSFMFYAKTCSAFSNRVLLSSYVELPLIASITAKNDLRTYEITFTNDSKLYNLLYILGLCMVAYDTQFWYCLPYYIVIPFNFLYAHVFQEGTATVGFQIDFRKALA